jgi:hypothetical protein
MFRVACYLCNTRSKTRLGQPLQAVPWIPLDQKYDGNVTLPTRRAALLVQSFPLLPS